MRSRKDCVRAVSSFLCIVQATLAFVPLQRNFQRLQSLAAVAKNSTPVTIHYSANFHRHVICKNGVVKESFMWLDEAVARYPDANVAPLCTRSAELLMKGNSENKKPDGSTKHRDQEEMLGPIIFGGGLEEAVAYNLTSKPSQSYFSMSNFDEETRRKYEHVIETLDSKLSSPFFSHFPKADHAWVQERIVFFLAPQPESFNQQDWVHTFCVQGKGVGLTESQTVTAIVALRHFLQLYPNDSSAGKPELPYFYHQLKVNFDLMDQARAELVHWVGGACAADLMTFAFLNSIHVSWDQCRIILESLSSSVVSCELEPSWELSSLSRPVRSKLDKASLHYLRMRLCLSPSEIFEMMKAHSRLSCYSTENLKYHMDAIQSMLALSSQDLSALVIKTPSILGTSVEKLDERMVFLSDEVNMTSAQIRKLALQFPSVLQYSVESNLRPKICYFKQDLGIASANLTKMILAAPSLLGRSLDKTIIPTVKGLCEDGGLSLSDVQIMVIQVPQILTSNWKTNLKQKVLYLEKRLAISDVSLKAFLAKSPRLLTHSIAKSMEPRIQILESISGDSEIAVKVVVGNPSLLLTNRAQFDQRVQLFRQSNYTFADSFSENSNVTKSRRKKPVLELLDGVVVRTLASVEAAALEIGTPKYNLYNIIKEKRAFKGKSYQYGTIPDGMSRKPNPVSSVSLRTSRDKKRKRRFLQDVRVNYVPEESSMRLVQLLQSTASLAHAGVNIEVNENQVYLAIFISSQIFPPKQVSVRQGTRKAGGYSIYVPQLQGIHTGGKLLRDSAERCFANLIPPETGGTSYAEGLVLLGYPYARPTRSRCGLYVCRDALRVASELLVSNRDNELKESSIHIDIFTDSNYAWDLLNNSTDLLRWGAYAEKDAYVYDGDAPEWKANVDILYPLSRTYYRLVKQDFLPVKGSKTKLPKPVAKEVVVRFRHKSEVGWSQEDSMLHILDTYARKAAAWQYETANTFPTV